jgi:pyruvate/2-oxoacid:ferredoxin oxidoreductase beta subunit
MRYDRAALQAVREQLRRAAEAADRGDYQTAHQALQQARLQVDRAWWLMVRQMRDQDDLGWEEIGRRLSRPGRRVSWQAVHKRYQRLEKRFQQPESPPPE